MVYIAIRSARASSGEFVERIGIKSTNIPMWSLVQTNVGYGVGGS